MFPIYNQSVDFFVPYSVIINESSYHLQTPTITLSFITTITMITTIESYITTGVSTCAVCLSRAFFCQ